MLARQALRAGMHEHRRLGQVARPLRRHQHHGGGAVALEAVVEQAERLGDPPGVEVGVEGERSPVHRGAGVALGVGAEGEGHLGELRSCRAVLVHVPAHEHRDLVGWA